MRLLRSTLLASAAISVAAPALSHAQTVETAPNAEAEGDPIVITGSYTLSERIDTATGLGLSLRETPQSVSVVTAQRIIDQNLASVADVIRNGVGVSVSEVDDVRNEFFARGFEIRNYQVDGVPTAWTLAGGAGETIADVSIYERVEIVRGATGLLSGSGDPSASVNLVRKHAESTEWGGYINASYGSWDNWRVSGDVGGAVTSDGRLRIRVVGRYEEGESYIDLFKNQKYVVYGVLEGDVTPNTLLRVGMSHQEGKPDAPAWGALPSFYSDGSFAVWPRSKTASADWSYWDTTNQNIFVSLRHDFGNDWNILVNYNRLRNAQSTELLYLSGLVDITTGDIQYSYPYKDRGENLQHSFDAQLKGKLGLFGREHELVLGALHSIQTRNDYTFDALSFPPGTDYETWDGTAYPYPGFSSTAFLAVDERVKQTGLYGALRLNVTDGFKLIGGGRLSNWKSTGYSFGVDSNYRNDDVFVPYVGALLDITPNHRLYASYTKIFQPQNFLGRDLRQLDPVDGKSYEIGLKSAFFNEALQTSIALFRIEQDNVADSGTAESITPPGGGLPMTTYLVANGTKSQGFEVEVTGQPLSGWNVSLGVSHFKVEDGDGDPINTDQPRTLVKAFTTYRFPLGGSALVLGGGVNYRSKAYSEGANPVTGTPFRFQQDGYALVNLMARFELNEQFNLQANVENLFDETYYSQIGFYSQYRYGRPRNYTVGATYRF